MVIDYKKHSTPTKRNTDKKTLTVNIRCDIILKLSRTACGLVAQLDRVFDYESKGRGFESRRAHQIKSPPFMGGDFICMRHENFNTRPVREWEKPSKATSMDCFIICKYKNCFCAKNSCRMIPVTV